ncbi:MAG: MmgE/PrpD family protein [Acidiferrobacterales bacterium]
MPNGSTDDDMPAIAKTVGQWIARLDLDDVPEVVIHAAKRSLIDVVGVTVAGSATQTADKIRRLILSRSTLGPCMLVGTDKGIGASAGAAFVNGVAAHTLDFDDTNYAGIVHASAVVFPATLAAAQYAGCDGKSLLTAFIAGVEVECLLGKALGDRLWFQGWWPTGVLGVIGAAVGAARVMGLTAPQIGEAIDIAAGQAIGMRACFGGGAKPYYAGRAAQAGLDACEAVAHGISGTGHHLDGENGFLALINDEAKAPQISNELGEVYSLIEPGAAFKLFPACSAVQAAVEATLAILEDENIDGADVEKVECEVTPLVFQSLRYSSPRTITECQFSMPFTVGCALAFGNFDAAHLRDEVLADPSLQSAMKKVVMQESTELASNPATMKKHPEAAWVTLHRRDGKQIRRFNAIATGMPDKPMSDTMLESKFHRCTSVSLSQGQAGQWLEFIKRLDGQPTVSHAFSL